MLRRPVTFVVALIFAMAASGFSMVLLMLGQPKLPSCACAFDQEPRQRRRPTSPPTNSLFKLRQEQHLRAPIRPFKYKSASLLKVAGRPFAFHQLDFVQESEAEKVDSETHSADDEMDYPSEEEVQEKVLGRTRSEEGLKQDNHEADLSDNSLGTRGKGKGERKAKKMSDCALFQRRSTVLRSSSQPQPYSPFSAPPEWLSPTSSSAASSNWIKKLFKSTKSTFKSKKSRSRSSSDSSNASSNASFAGGEET